MSSIGFSFDNQLSFIAREMTRYIYSIFLILGVTGCCLNLILLSRRQFQTSSCCTYFSAMSFNMLGHLIVALGLYLYALDHEDPVTSVLIICKIRFYFLQSTAMRYRWCLTLACFDRFALSSGNVRLRNFSQVKIARRVVIILTIIWILLPIHILVFYEINNNRCGIFFNIAASFYHSIFVTFTASILPLSIMIICALLIHRNLAFKRERCRQWNIPQAEKLQSKRDQQVLIMLLLQIIFYTTTILPLMSMYFYSALTVYQTKSPDQLMLEQFINYVVEMINFLFPVCSFYLYTMASRMFRLELKKFFARLWPCLHLEHTARIGPMIHEMRVRNLMEHPIPIRTRECN